MARTFQDIVFARGIRTRRGLFDLGLSGRHGVEEMKET